jgi:hypothetical protein
MTIQKRKYKRGAHVSSHILDCIIMYTCSCHVPTKLWSRLPIKKRLMFPGKTLRKTNTKKKKVTPKLEDDTKTEMAIDKPSASTQPDAPDECGTEKTIRKSTRTSVIVRQAEREAIRAEKEATAKVSSIYQQPFHF